VSDFSAAPKGQNRPDRTQGRTSDGHRSFNQTHVVAKGAPYDKHEESEAEQGRRCRLCPRARSYDNGDDRPGQHQSDHQWHTDIHDDDHRREWGTGEQPHRRGAGLPSLHDPMLPRSVPGRADATPHLIGCRTRLAGDCDTPCVSNRTLIADVETVIVHRGELVAAVMTVNRTPWEGDPSCPFIIEAFTAPEHRRAGLATTLLVTAATAVSAHDRSIALRVDDTNTDAIRLYEKLGFREWPDAPTT
jgi:GNAT superfamily N-acetyltransferase